MERDAWPQASRECLALKDSQCEPTVESRGQHHVDRMLRVFFFENEHSNWGHLFRSSSRLGATHSGSTVFILKALENHTERSVVKAEARLRRGRRP